MELGDWPSWLALIGVAAAFLLSFRQYVEAQKWKRSEFVAQQMEKFFAQPKVVTALLLLDYSRIKLRPNGTRADIDDDGIIFDDALSIQAVRDHTEFEDETEKFTRNEMIAREAFDEFLTGIERFHHFVEAGLVTFDDLRPYLRYWLNVMTNPSWAWKEPDFYPAIDQFIKTYQYTGVKRMVEVLRSPPPMQSAAVHQVAPKTAPAVPAIRRNHG